MGVVNTQYTFAANDVITSTKMNDIIDQTTVDGSAIFGNTLEVAGGKLKVRAQGITSNELATDAVTNTQITNGSVTYDKLGAGGPAWDGNGVLYTNGLRLSHHAPVLNFNETDTGKQWFWVADGGGFSLRFNDYNTYSLSADGSGNVTFFQNATTNGTSTVHGAASFASTASFGGNVSFNSGAITAKGYASSDSKGVLFLGNASNGYIYNNGTHLEFSSPTGGISYLASSGTIWQSNNDGAGSGLDADLLDGMQPSAFNAGSTIVSRDSNGDSSFRNIGGNDISASANLVSHAGRITSQGYGGFPERGVIFLGNNETGYVYNNGSALEFRSPTGGLSTLTSSGTIWTSGNDGAGSGLDADLLDGLETSAANAVNTIVRRDGNGDSGFRNINCSQISTGPVNCSSLSFGDDAGLLYDSGVGSVSIRYGVTGAEKYSTFGPDGSLIVGGALATSTGNIRTYNFGGVTNAGVVYFGDGDNFVYHNGSNFQFKFGASVTATLSSSGTIWTDDNTSARVTASKLSGAQTGAAPVYGARAYANFNCNGVAIGGLALKGSSGNIGNITKLAVGKYNIAFSTAMPSSGYAIIGTCNNNTTGAAGLSGVIVPYAQAAGDVNVSISDVNSSALYDPQWCNIVIFA